jgi:type II secretory pathway pseudopilin PulG
MARENQGLHIALIVLFMVTIVLAVTTYVFCRQYLEADQSAQKFKQDLAAANQANTRIQGEYNQAKKWILGTPDAEQKEFDDLKTQFNTDMETFAGAYDNVDKFYRPVLVHLDNLLKAKNQQLTDAHDAMQKLQDDYNAWKIQMTAQVKKHEAAQQAAEEKLKAATAAYDATLAQVKTGKDQIQAEWDKARDENDKHTKALEAERDKARDAQKNLIISRDQLAGELDDLKKETIDVPDGQITGVDQRNATAWINLGSGDALGRKTTFSVYPSDIMANQAAGGKKASIEVTRILGEHLAETRIVEDTASDPIMIGDKIDTPVWNPGEAVTFALVGLMDMDHDGTSDLQTVKELIELSGGKVDYWNNGKGIKGGKMTVHTRYLVVDTGAREFKEEPDKAKAKVAAAQARAYSAEIDEARLLGLKKITLGELLKQMGWKRQTSVVRYGRGANPKDFPPRAPQGIPPVSTGTVSDLFRPRRAPAGEPAPRGGAY